MRANRRLLLATLVGLAGVVALTAIRAQAAAPAGRYTIATDTVTDEKTGLTWQRATAPGTYTLAEASTYCTGLGGMWRLPSIRELQTLVDVLSADPSIDAIAFPGTQSDLYWSSTPYAANGSVAWVVNFEFGSSYPGPSATGYVRCVQ